VTPSDEREPQGKGQEKGFVVIDRRGRESEPAEAATAPGAGKPGASPRPLPGVDFASFAVSLGTSALYHMGVLPDPETGKPGARKLELARQTIDALEMLQRKTRGNLDAEEEELLQRLLTDLRMRYVEASKG
jgi:hypothetical protein